MCRRLTITRDTAMDLIRCPKTLSLEIGSYWRMEMGWCLVFPARENPIMKNRRWDKSCAFLRMTLSLLTPCQSIRTLRQHGEDNISICPSLQKMFIMLIPSMCRMWCRISTGLWQRKRSLPTLSANRLWNRHPLPAAT